MSDIAAVSPPLTTAPASRVSHSSRPTTWRWYHLASHCPLSFFFLVLVLLAPCPPPASRTWFAFTFCLHSSFLSSNFPSFRSSASSPSFTSATSTDSPENGTAGATKQNHGAAAAATDVGRARARQAKTSNESERRHHSGRSQQARTQRSGHRSLTGSVREEMMGSRVRIRYPHRCPRSLLPRWPWPTTPDRKQILKVTLVNLLVTKAGITTVSGSLDLKKTAGSFF